MVARSPWWMPHVHADRRPFLRARNLIQAALRSWFVANDFLEISVPALQVSPGNETHLHAFETTWTAPGGQTARYYLHTSPEFACKKLLAAGETRIATFADVFRNRECGPLHLPEFTMLEWYRAREPYDALMADCTAVLQIAAEVTQLDTWQYKGLCADPRATPERLTVAQAFRLHAGIDLEATNGNAAIFADAARRSGIFPAADDTWSDIFSRVLSTCVEPCLGIGRPTILFEYPISEAALARPKPGDPKVAERFELYVCGVEIANAFGELTDANEQRRRFMADMDEKAAIYGERYPIDEDFLAALGYMPPACGIALGFDRLVMLAVGASRVDQVSWAPFVPAEED